MLLESLRMRNFRQYKGEQKIRFSTDPYQNVTIILGNNTFGKTTLLQAFSWCLYRHVNLDNPSDLLNYDVQWRMREGDEEEVLVELTLLHDGREYIITTTQLYYIKSDQLRSSHVRTDISYTDSDGQRLPVKANKVDSVIKSILPEDLSGYFFFDTERVENISEKKDLADSVKGLLGLTPLENAIKHLGFQSQKRTVLGKLYEQLDQRGDQRAREALDTMHVAQARLEEIDDQLDNCNSQIETYLGRKQTIEKTLREYEPVAKLQYEKESLEEDVERDTDLANSNVEALRKLIGTSSIHYFVIPLVEEAEKLLDDADVSDKGIKDLTKTTLEDIIKNRETCICGCKFADHPEAIDHIKEEMRYCPPENIGSAVRHFREDLAVFKSDPDEVMESVENAWVNISAAKIRIQDSQDAISDIEERIAGKGNIGNLQLELNNVKQRIKDLNEKRDSLIKEKGEKSKEIEHCKKTYDTYAMASEKNAETAMFISYAEEIKDWLSTTYREREASKRERLTTRVNELFEQMYHGTRRVTLDQKYQVHLLTPTSNDEEKETGESGGLNSVKNFAFIAGLVSLAKEKTLEGAVTREGDPLMESYPLVMDAPFSKADEIHTANISRVLPEASEQVIMFVMRKDWMHAERVLKGRVGMQYELEKYSEQHSSLKEI